MLPLRAFDGQRFVRHIAADAAWVPWRWLGCDANGFAARDTAIAGARVVRGGSGAATQAASHDGELLFLFVLSGSLQLQSASLGEHALHAGDSVTIPAAAQVSLRAYLSVEFLEVTLPANTPP